MKQNWPQGNPSESGTVFIHSQVLAVGASFHRIQFIYKSYQFEGGGLNLHRSLQPVAFKGEARTRPSFCVTRKSGTWMFPKTHFRFFEFRIGTSSVSRPTLTGSLQFPEVARPLARTRIDGGGDGGGADGDLGAWWSSKSENLPIILHCQAHV